MRFEFKDDVKVIKEGMECGIGIEGAGKFKENDIIVTFEIHPDFNSDPTLDDQLPYDPEL
mgnify:CR=1 FL=1